VSPYESDAEEYAFAIMTEAGKFAHAHPESYKRMATGIFATYQGERGGYVKRMKQLDQLAAEAHGFPAFKQWLAARSPAAA
jgi:hypothetical protein